MFKIDTLSITARFSIDQLTSKTRILLMQKSLLKMAFEASLLCCLTALGTLCHAQGSGASALYQRSLAATCANCHGTDSKGVVGGGMPLINQLTSAQMLSQLLAYKNGTREGTIMPQLSKGYSDEQLETIARQLGKQP